MREVSATLGYVPNITDCFFCNCIVELFQWEVFFYTGFGTATTTTTTADKFGKNFVLFRCEYKLCRNNKADEFG